MPPKLYLDENLSPRLAEQLRLHGFDVIATSEAGLAGAADSRQLVFAAQAGRALVTVNHKDFAALHEQYLAAEQAHAGIILTTEETTHVLRRRLLRLLNTLTPGDLLNQIRWLNEFKAPDER